MSPVAKGVSTVERWITELWKILINTALISMIERGLNVKKMAWNPEFCSEQTQSQYHTYSDNYITHRKKPICIRLR